ncbi:MAG TPA: formate/nitrite transporter family protein [Candidatus Intestinimonas stercoravium]|nr:formate/nitrite transporter family protein [Candidatus Intestinimonas stercoravium]
MERLYLSPGETIDAYSTAGRTKLRRSASSLLLLGILAGAIIAVAAAATNTAVYGISDTWTLRTICALIFPFGLGLVVVTGAELFTGNCMLPITLLDGGGTIGQMLRNWVLVYIGNTLGALLVAGLCVFCGQLDYSSGALAVYTIRVGAGKCALSFWNGLGLGILCNVLVCLGVLAANSAKETAGRLLGAYLPVCFFVLCGFEHSVADLYYIGAALMAAAVPEYAAQAVAAGVDLAPLGMAGAVSALIPVTLGNILGGAGLGALLWYCHGARGRSGR